MRKWTCQLGKNYSAFCISETKPFIPRVIVQSGPIYERRTWNFKRKQIPKILIIQKFGCSLKFWNSVGSPLSVRKLIISIFYSIISSSNIDSINLWSSEIPQPNPQHSAGVRVSYHSSSFSRLCIIFSVLSPVNIVWNGIQTFFFFCISRKINLTPSSSKI